MTNAIVSITRLPVDHMISGALLAGITAGGINYNEYKKGEISSKKAIRQTAKYTIQGGLTASVAISASNKIVRKNYVGAALSIVLGIGGIIMTEKFFENKEE